MKKIISITIKTIIIVFLTKMLIGLTSIPFDPNLDSNFSTQEFWDSAKKFLQLVILGAVISVISFSTNKDLISKPKKFLIFFSISIFSVAFILALFPPYNSWFLTGFQLSLSLFLIFRQLSILMYTSNQKLSSDLSTTSSILSIISCFLIFMFSFYS